MKNPIYFSGSSKFLGGPPNCAEELSNLDTSIGLKVPFGQLFVT